MINCTRAPTLCRKWREKIKVYQSVSGRGGGVREWGEHGAFWQTLPHFFFPKNLSLRVYIKEGKENFLDARRRELQFNFHCDRWYRSEGLKKYCPRLPSLRPFPHPPLRSRSLSLPFFLVRRSALSRSKLYRAGKVEGCMMVSCLAFKKKRNTLFCPVIIVLWS